jgi:dihydrofolate reductase
MSRLRMQISMSADGYVAGPNQSREQPLGQRGEELHGWVSPLRWWRESHNMDGGETGPDNDVVHESFENVGATIMGRHMFGAWDGAWDMGWRGWWGENPPYHHPVFVLTHHPRESLKMQGGTTFHFVTDGIHAALGQARAAAHGKDVHVAGGAQIVQQYLKAGLIDEMELHVVPLLLGGGARLFENTEARQRDYELVRVVSSPTVSHFKYRRR